ncbi:MAG: transposase [Halobacteriovoraceae bacterium]|nr:transposase [Halobacteriovoraceae bacterium]
MESTQITGRKYFTRTQKMKILEELNNHGMTISDIARRHGIHPMTVYKWRRKMTVPKEHGNTNIEGIFTEIDRLKKENDYLKTAVGELTIDKQILQTANDILKKRQMEIKLKSLKRSSKS